MIVWIKSKDERCVRLIDNWNPSFYVSAPSEKDLIHLTWYLNQNDIAVKYGFEEKFVRLQDSERSKVLRVTVPEADRGCVRVPLPNARLSPPQHACMM